MGKRLLLAILAVLLGAAPASAAYYDMQAGAFNASFRYVATSSLTTSDYLVAPARGFNRMAFTKGSAFAATVYACETNTYVAASCTSVTTLSASDTDIEVTTGRPWFVIDVTTAETGSNVSYITIKSNPQEASGGGGGGATSDADGDGLYEARLLWDADGDGSSEVPCTAANAPDPGCTALSETVYRDFVDDMNCAMHGCGYGQMERNGTIYLKDAVVYIEWPCWTPAAVSGHVWNDPSAANDNAHDSTADDAYVYDCPASPDPNTTRRLGSLAFLDWQGEVIGGGFDTRNPANTTSYLRDKGTYISNDMGPYHAGVGDNVWWGVDGHLRGMSFGFIGSHATDTTLFINSGEDAGDFDSKGYATVSGNQTIEATNAVVCITQANIGTPVAGDPVIIYGASQTTAGTSPTVAALMRVLSYSTTDCNGAGTASITLGGTVAGTYATTFQGSGSDVPYAYSLINGMNVTIARSDVLDSSARISNVTFIPQDAWNDSTNDCAGTGVFTFSGDTAQGDLDCDTNTMVGLFGGGHVVLEDVVFRSWHAYAIDGDSNIGNPLIRRTQFLYGNGQPVMDAGTGWVVEDVEVRNAMFESYVFSMYGPGQNIDGVRIYNSNGTGVFKLDSQSIYNQIENVELSGSSFSHAVTALCGARMNTLSNFRLSNVKGFGNGYTQGMGVYLACTNTANPIEMNTFSNFTFTGSGFADATGGYSPDQNIAIVSIDTGAVKGTTNAAAVARNRFEGFNYKFTESSANFEACMFGVIDNAVATRVGVGVDFDLEQVFANNVFYGNTIYNSGSGADLMYCDCGLQDGSAPAGGTNSCGDSILGTAADGVNARGCMNTDKDVAVSSSIQTCN